MDRFILIIILVRRHVTFKVRVSYTKESTGSPVRGLLKLSLDDNNR